MATLDSNPLARLVERTLARLRYAFVRAVPGNAVKQNADGSLQVQPDGDTYPATNPTPYRLGVPGMTCRVAPGARCLVSYEDADPGKPVVTSWGKATLQELVIAEGSAGAARVGDTVDAGLHLDVVAGVDGLSVRWEALGAAPGSGMVAGSPAEVARAVGALVLRLAGETGGPVAVDEDPTRRLARS